MHLQPLARLLFQGNFWGCILSFVFFVFSTTLLISLLLLSSFTPF
ncbi:hypothetical protein LEP1GSC070_0980 [Leptospira santarosai str. AIM]|nr:hypothetical protein LEP1GSC070_0980 [Leptospira santarosai str. AIM]